MKKSGTLIIACLAAAAAGVAIGMLLAPEKGDDLRKNIKAKLASLMGDDKDAPLNPEPGERVTPAMEGEEASV